MGITLHQHGHSHGGSSHVHAENINVRAAFVHVVGDFLQSFGVLVAAIVIYFKVCILYFLIAIIIVFFFNQVNKLMADYEIRGHAIYLKSKEIFTFTSDYF